MNFYKKYAFVWAIAVLCMGIIVFSNIGWIQVSKEKKNIQAWALYLASFGNYETDGKWINWKIKKGAWTDENFEPPLSIPSVYYPFLGLYSSHHKATIKKHFKMLTESSISAIIVEWDGPNRQQSKESEKNFIDISLQLLFNVSTQFDIQIGVILSDYYNRTEKTVIEDVNYYLTKYGNHKNCLKLNNKPVIFIDHKFDLLTEFAQENVSFIGFGETIQDALDSFENGFEGFTSYLPNLENSELNEAEKWKNYSRILSSRKMAFIPSICPGKNATAFNVQLSQYSCSRKNGQFYDYQWEAAIESDSKVVLINSFNDWFHGTVIEPVENNAKFPLNNDIWTGNNSFYFLEKTKKWIQ